MCLNVARIPETGGWSCPDLVARSEMPPVCAPPPFLPLREDQRNKHDILLMRASVASDDTQTDRPFGLGFSPCRWPAKRA